MKQSKILYSILREIKEGNEVNEETYGITKEEFGQIIEYALEKTTNRGPLITGVGVIRNGRGNSVWAVMFRNPTVTIDGEEYLKEHSVLAKGYKVAKEIRDWLYI